MEKALEKLEKLAESVRIIDQPRHYSHSEVKKLIEIAYLEGELDYDIELHESADSEFCTELEIRINKLLNSF